MPCVSMHFLQDMLWRHNKGKMKFNLFEALLHQVLLSFVIKMRKCSIILSHMRKRFLHSYLCKAVHSWLALIMFLYLVFDSIKKNYQSSSRMDDLAQVLMQEPLYLVKSAGTIKNMKDNTLALISVSIQCIFGIFILQFWIISFIKNMFICCAK